MSWLMTNITSKVTFLLHMAKLLGKILLLTCGTTFFVDGLKYDNCDIDVYYANLLLSNLLQDENALHQLLQESHRDVIPYTSSSKLDCWDALVDLDQGKQPGTVALIYGNRDVPSEPRGTSSTWNREHLWPKSHGVSYEGPDFTDLHHLRPADATVNTSRSNRFFASCGVAEPEQECVMPAHSEAAIDTERDTFTFLPPTNKRGDIARALFYMALRYNGEEETNTDALVLTDCPGSVLHSMGYLSQLLQWHMWDPVDDEERARNDRVCSNWQGNRNPYVDFPDLVEVHFKTPQTPPDPMLGGGYSACTILPEIDVILEPTSAPSPAPTPADSANLPGSCRGMKEGDVLLTGFNSDGTDDGFILTTTVDISPGSAIYVTDNGWTGTSFRTNERTAQLIVPESGIVAGATVGFGGIGLPTETEFDSLWTGSLQLSTAGDNIHVYCLDNPSDTFSVVHLHAVNFADGGWLSEPVVSELDLGTNESVLPATLTSSGSLALSHYDNGWYVGPREGSKEDLLSAVSDKTNWRQSNTDLMDAGVVLTPFTITQPFLPGSCQGLTSGDIIMTAFNSDGSLDGFVLTALRDIPHEAAIYVTDNAWTGSNFLSNERTARLLVPDGGIAKGSIIGYGGEGLLTETPFDSLWTGSVQLSTSGDNIHVYCLTDPDNTSSVHHLHAVTFAANGWLQGPRVSETDIGTNESVLPTTLPPGCSLELSHKDNGWYTGPRTGTREEILSAVASSGQWYQSDSDLMDPATVLNPFTVIP